MEELLDSLIEELQESVKKVVSSPPANYVRVHEWSADYAEAVQQSGSVFRDNMNEIERMLCELDEPGHSPAERSASQRSSASPSFALESLMNDLKEFQEISKFLKTVELELEHELTLSRISAQRNTGNNGSSAAFPMSPALQHPPTLHPPTQHPPTQHPPTQHPPTQHPPTQHPPTQHPPTQHPPTQNPPTQNPPTHYPPTRSPLQNSRTDSVDSPNLHISGEAGTKCSSCGEQIQGQMVHALDRTWHLEHFVCAGGCGAQLGRQTFYEMSDRAYCETCYQAEFSPRCAHCDGPILDRCLTALGRRWHPEHFFCQRCTAPFSETAGFHERDGRPYCLDCYSSEFAPKCRGCSEPITAKYVTALASMWHPECFACQDCGRDLGGRNFYELSGRPYCEQHYHTRRGTLCVACEQAITSRCITAMGRKYHPECFQCAFCNKQLSQGTFKEKESRPYCSDCYAKLFRKK